MKAAFLSALVFLFSSLTAHAADVKLWRMDCGSIQINNLDLFSDTFKYAGRTKTAANSCYLIKHNSELLLWDAGLPAALLNAPAGHGPFVPSLQQTIVQQLQAINVKPEAVGQLALSHYHFDHVGQSSAFPQAKLLMGKADFEALKADPLPFGADASPLQPWLQGAQPVDMLTGDRDVFGDGSVVMLYTPGHTPGHYALLVRLAKTGPVVLSGDAAMFQEQYDGEEVPSFNVDRAQSIASMQRLKGIVKSLGATMILNHDLDSVGKLPTFPASAE